MIQGVVIARYEAVIRLRLRGPNHAECAVDAVIDSGFSASMALPSPVIAAFGLVAQSGGRAVLADGSVRTCAIHAAEVEWGGRWRTVLVAAVGKEPLVGVRLLAGHELRIEVEPGGRVEITPLPRTTTTP